MVVGNHTWCNAGWEQCPTPSDGKEAVDRKTIYLEQEELIKQVFRINPKMVVVLNSSFPYAITWTQHNVSAVVHLVHNSQEEGTALADVLFGDYNPGGRLVQTWPRSMEQLPPMMDYNIRNGRTYMYFKGEPLYPFGYGLSYTTFAYSGFKVNRNSIKADEEVTVTVDITNTGKRDGDEVVQLYIQHLYSAIARPEKELKAFKRITLKKGEKKTVQLKFTVNSLKYWDENLHRYILENDRVKVMAGSSSADIKFQKIMEILK
jgi:beta-glucosidase